MGSNRKSEMEFILNLITEINRKKAFEIVALGDNQNLKKLFNKILNKATRSYLENETEKCMNEKMIFPKKTKEEKEKKENKEEESDLWPKYSYRLAYKKHLTKNILNYLILNDNEAVDKFIKNST